MSERDDRAARSGRQPAEGVRILKAEEAQAAIDAGEAAGRRPDDQLRFGDVPPAPSGPRPAHRFPLPDSVNPAEAVALPPLARRSEPPGRGPARGADPTAEVAFDDIGAALAEPGGPDEPAGEASDSAARPAAHGAVPAGGDRAAGAGPGHAGPEDRRSAPLDPDDRRPAMFSPEPPAADPPPARPAWTPPAEVAQPAPPAPARPAGVTPDPAAPPFETRPAAVRPDDIGGRGAPGRAIPRQGDDVDADAPPWTARSGWDEPGTDRTTEMGVPTAHIRPSPPAAPSGPVPSAEIPDEGITVSGAIPEMPHWSEPPTGEVPRLRFEDTEDDDLEDWRAAGSRGARWRDVDDWSEADELSDLVSDEEPVGALDQTRTEHSDIYSFDEDFERVTSRTGSNPVLDLTGVEDGEAALDDDWPQVGQPVGGAGRGQARTDARGRRGSRFGRRGSAETRGAGGGRGGARFGGAAATGAAGAVAAGAAGAAAAQTTAGPGEGAPVGGASGAAARRGRPGPSSGPRPGPGRQAVPGAPAAATATEPPSRRPVSASERPGARPAPRPAADRPSGGDVGSRVAVGVGLIVLLAIAYAIGPKALVALSVVIVVAAAAEAYNMTRAPGFRPATFLGLVATVGCVLGAYWKGIGAIPVVTVLLFAGAMLWYVLGVVQARPLANVAVTVMVFVWVSVLGSFSAVLLQMGHGKGLFLGAVLVGVAADVFAFVVGRWIGSRPMASHISPNKTIEGFLGGLVGAAVVGLIVGKWVTPWGGMKHGLLLGIIVGLIAPVGDLFESMLKRDLGIKDSGSVLGGHGGLLDRFDSILLALPAAYFVATIVRV